jgi:hypothetical protein
MPQFVIFRKGGEPGKVAINPNLVTEIRSSPGPYTDIHFGAHRVAVEGTFEQVADRLSGRGAGGDEPPPVEGWLNRQVGHR